jgi:hypothetical protein
MAHQVSAETQALLDAADLAVARSKAILEQTRQVRAEAHRKLRAQELRFMLLREMKKQN